MPRGGAGPRDPEVARQRGVLAVTVRDHGRESPQAEECRRKLQALNAAQKVDELVASWPELSDEKLNRIAGLLRAGARGGTEAQQ